MSRIYEALLKAESERANSGRTADTPLNPLPESFRQSAVAVAEPEFDRGGLRLDLVVPQHGTPVDEPASSFALAPGHDALDIASVRQLAWTPSLSQLPSLMDRGATVEQFRSLRSRIFELRDISPLKSILVSSGLPQEGKSFVAANLAISLARHKNTKVLLIDGDMRRYTLHQLLGCEAHPGLADYLAGKSEIVDVMQRSIEPSEPAVPGKSKTGYGPMPPNLTFIAGGNGGDKAADLSGNARFGELIRKASPYFDWIIVDSSPVIPVSDAVNLARSCDGVLLVARSGVTKYPIAQRAQAELKASNILGFVLNAVNNSKKSGYDGYDGYDSYDAETA